MPPCAIEGTVATGKRPVSSGGKYQEPATVMRETVIKSVGLDLRRLIMSGIGRRVDIVVTDCVYWILRRFDPNLTMGRFYARLGMWVIRLGFTHNTLGSSVAVQADAGSDRKVVVPTMSSDSGKPRFEQLLDLGLRPDDVVVDYGCGTLRVGRYLIDFLSPGAYWGFDLNDDLLDLARSMLGADRLGEKRPNILPIADQNLAACVAAHPRFVMSIAVLMHVPPCDLDDFCRNVTMLGGTGTIYYLTFSAASVTTRTAGTTWSYGRDEVVAAFQRHLPEHEITTRLLVVKARFKGETLHSAVLIATPQQARPRPLAVASDSREIA